MPCKLNLGEGEPIRVLPIQLKRVPTSGGAERLPGGSGRFAANVLPIAVQIQPAGATTHRVIAEAPNAPGSRTGARGGLA